MLKIFTLVPQDSNQSITVHTRTVKLRAQELTLTTAQIVHEYFNRLIFILTQWVNI